MATAPGFSRSARLTAAGRYNRSDLQAVVNVPFSETVKSSYALSYKAHDGHVNNLRGGPDQGDENALAGRAAFLIEVTTAARRAQ